MNYLYFDQGDERLLELADLPTQCGIAVALRTTGHSRQDDEIVELCIADLDGKVLFEQRVRPQNVEEWQPSAASGNIRPADVSECPELYQFEDEIIAIFEKASIVVAEHLDFMCALVSGSWISLPAFRGFDFAEEFRLAHCAADYRDEPATAASLAQATAHYGISAPMDSISGEAKALAGCYRAFVDEHICERDGKGADYWEQRERRLAQEAAADSTRSAAEALREKRFNQMNGLLWVAGAIIFVSLVIQLQQRGGDLGFMIVSGAVAVFCLIRAVANFRK